MTIKSESLKNTERRLVEAKIYSGPSYHAQAIGQLVSRYSTGRQSRGYVLEYVTKPRISDIVLKLRNKADAELPVQQAGATGDHPIKWAYKSNHRHSSGEIIDVVHINVSYCRYFLLWLYSLDYCCL